MAQTGTGTKGRHMAARARKKAPDMGIDLFSAKLTFDVAGTRHPECQRLLDRILDDWPVCRGMGLAWNPDDPGDVMVMALMKEGWQQAGTLSPEDAETISEVAGGVVSIVDWYVDRYLDGRPLGLRINVSIA